MKIREEIKELEKLKIDLINDNKKDYNEKFIEYYNLCNKIEILKQKLN